jgi:hypothetical protein
MEKGQKVYIVLNGKLVEETCTENPYTCKRHASYHRKRIQFGGMREEYVKKFFDTSDLPEKEHIAKTDFQPPNYKRIGLKFRGEYYNKHEEAAVKLAAKLTDEEKESILYYTGAGYIDILNHVYGRPRRVTARENHADGTEKILYVGEGMSDEEWEKEMETHIDNMNKAIGLAGEQQEPEILYRAILAHNEDGKFDRWANPAEEIAYDKFVENNFKIGETFYRKTITSTSADPAAAVSFFLKPEQRQNGQAVIIEYLTAKGARLSRDAGTSKMIHREHEVILPPYQKFKVVAVHKNVKYTVDARERFKDRGIHPDKFGNIVAPNVTVVQVIED